MTGNRKERDNEDDRCAVFQHDSIGLRAGILSLREAQKATAHP